ncbi:hypothetical protein [Helicobacter cetorum]|uniref:hypothetical protein n=1 Tax=Helicobacter cetorum TaxID=138563 RepID=UPI0018F848FD|nr:hypothetical protein [Helicobacter cetorum]
MNYPNLPSPNLDITQAPEIKELTNKLLKDLQNSLNHNGLWKEQVELSLKGIVRILEILLSLDFFKNANEIDENLRHTIEWLQESSQELKAKMQEYTSYFHAFNTSMQANAIEVEQTLENNKQTILSELERLENEINSKSTELLEGFKIVLNTALKNAHTALNQAKTESLNALNELLETLKNQLQNRQQESLRLLENSQSTALSEINSNKENAINAITQDKASVLSEINSNKENAINAITQDKASVLSEINSNKENAINAITQDKASVLSEINSNKENAINAITQDKASVLSEINSNKTNALNELTNKTSESLENLKAQKRLELESFTNTANEKIRELNNLNSRLITNSGGVIKVFGRFVNVDYQKDVKYINTSDEFQHFFYLANSQDEPLFKANRKYLVEVWLPYELAYIDYISKDNSHIMLVAKNSETDKQALYPSIKSLVNTEIARMVNKRYRVYSHYYVKFLYSPSKDYMALSLMGCRIVEVVFCPTNAMQYSGDALDSLRKVKLNNFESIYRTKYQSILEEGYFTLTELEQEPKIQEVINGQLR